MVTVDVAGGKVLYGIAGISCRSKRLQGADPDWARVRHAQEDLERSCVRERGIEPDAGDDDFFELPPAMQVGHEHPIGRAVEVDDLSRLAGIPGKARGANDAGAEQLQAIAVEDRQVCRDARIELG